jgi:hypothetical protein
LVIPLFIGKIHSENIGVHIYNEEVVLMLNLECHSKLSEKEVVQKIRQFFGEGGLGLALVDEEAQCLTFEGGGGYVTATLCAEKGGTRIDFVTQEWDYQVKEFASKIS